MRDEVSCTRRENGTGEKLILSGDVDGSSGAELERAVISAVDGQTNPFRMDISELAFIDSTGAHALLHVHNAIAACGWRAVFENPGREVRSVLHLLGLDQVLDIRP
jgi:anti-anti-sigma factor